MNLNSYFPARLLLEEPSQANEYKFEIFLLNQIIWCKYMNITGLIPAPEHVTLKTLYEDLVDAVDISEASISWNLLQRYNDNKIYSSIGTILIAINPYQNLEELYSEEIMKRIMNFQQVDFISGKKLSPHIWNIADNAFRQLKINLKKQAIVISGESGKLSIPSHLTVINVVLIGGYRCRKNRNNEEMFTIFISCCQ